MKRSSTLTMTSMVLLAGSTLAGVGPVLAAEVTADRLVFEDRGYILATDEMAGGRGINASRVIHSFGGKTLAILTSGGSSGARLEALVKAYGFPVEVAPICNEIRTNLTITDKQGLTVKLNEAGPAIENRQAVSGKDCGRLQCQPQTGRNLRCRQERGI